ncbi:MAG TPA: hypothetical protein VI757_11260 [Bacteroidia bacterium]|nr:hypothetical protein [Bacteroidia bacterium]
MADERRISATLSGFDIYIRRAVPYVDAGAPIKNGTRLGLSALEITDAVAFHDTWYTGNPAARGIYELHSNPNTKNKNTRNSVVTLMKDFNAFFSPLLTRMGTSGAITEDDRLNLNLPAADRTPTARGVINDEPLAGIKSLASARIKFRIRLDEDATRASMHPLADAIEVRYQIGGTQPANANVCPGTVISKKAMFTFDAGVDNDGKKFYSFVRYVNQSNPENNGPWRSVPPGTVQG